MEPSDADAVAGLESRGAGTGSFDNAGDLMTRYDGLLARREFAFANVKVRAANRAGIYFDQNLAGARLRSRDVGEMKRVGFDGRGLRQNLSAHIHIVTRYLRNMAKRVMVAVVGAGIGGLAGLLISFLGSGWNAALWICAVIGAIVPLIFLGQPGH